VRGIAVILVAALAACGDETLRPGLPSEVEISAKLPRDPFLDFSIAVLPARTVERGAVRFSVRLADGGRRFTVFEEVVRARGGGEFLPRKLNLAAFRGRDVTLTLAADPAHPEAVGAWVDDVEVVWKDPRVVNRPPPSPPRHPSIVFILVDTLRRDYLGFHGFEGDISPNLDRLAMESVIFENAFAQAPWTKPSVASLFTSLHPETHGLDNHEGLFGDRGNQALETGILPDEAFTLAEALKDAGYRTAAFVANPWLDGAYGFGQGFDTYEIVETLPEILERARKFLREDGEPFLLYLHFMDVHGPYDAPEADFEAMAKSPSLDSPEVPPVGGKLPAYLDGISWFGEDDLRRRDFGEIVAFRLSRSHTVRARYAGNVRDFDRRIGPFLDEIRSSDLDGRAIVALTADHGEELLEHGGWDHGFNLHDHQLRVPLLVRLPGARDARRAGGMASLLDVMPTLLGLANVEVPPGVEGVDRMAKASETTFSAATKHREDVHAVRTDRRKLILDGKTGSASLFDLEADPREYRDISKDNVAETENLLGLLSRHLEKSRRSRLSPRNQAIPEDIRKRLESLGYLREKGNR
jgi:arylsulfatase A-like enzyme